MKRRRVVITGLGVVAPNGIGKEAFWANLIAGHSAVDYITAFDASTLPCCVAAEVKSFDPTDWMNAKKARRISRVSQFAIAAARLALEDSKLQLNDRSRKRVGVCFGTTTGKPDFDREYENYLDSGPRGISSLGWAEFSPHASTSHIAIDLGLKGSSTTLSTGCATGLDTINWAFEQIRLGMADAIIAGSADSLLSPFLIAGLSRTGLTTSNNDPSVASRPYDLYRDGIIPGEAAGALVLEELDFALDRGAHVYGEIAGHASVIEGLEIPNRDVSGGALAKALKTALLRAQLRADEVDYICSHGISHPESDLMETNAFKKILEEAAYSTPISSIKSMIGDSVAASGALQAIASALILQDGIIPPTINLHHADPRCDLDYVPNQARKARVQNVLMNARAIGGSHSVLILSDWRTGPVA